MVGISIGLPLFSARPINAVEGNVERRTPVPELCSDENNRKLHIPSNSEEERSDGGRLGVFEAWNIADAKLDQLPNSTSAPKSHLDAFELKRGMTRSSTYNSALGKKHRRGSNVVDDATKRNVRSGNVEPFHRRTVNKNLLMLMQGVMWFYPYLDR